ncbi:MAG: hypothetical protein KJ579_00185, partial [Verrucomicrobia bacterium]|nr:hypothetical protein [Verrucomicrobiota bacterium]
MIDRGLASGGEWTPVSVLNFRFAVPDPEAARIERDLTSLVVGGLAARPGTIVLERAKLLQAVFEKAMTGETDPFWSGAYLVEGTIRRDGDRLVAQPLLKPPAGGRPVQIPALSLATNDLPQGASRIVSALAVAIGTRAHVDVAWSHEAEAGVLGSEAKWCYRNNHMQKAVDLAEAAMALGSRDVLLRNVRVLAETQMAHPQPGPRSPLAGSEFGVRTVRLVPDSESLAQALGHAQRALTALLDNYRRRSATPLESGSLDPDERDLAFQPARAASAILRAIHDADREDEFADETSHLRVLLRQTREKMHNPAFLRKDNIFDMNRIAAWVALEASFSGFWYERADDAFAAYRTLLQIPVGVGEATFGDIRRTLGAPVAGSPVAGTKAGRSQDPRLAAARDVTATSFETRWRGFLKTLQRDPDPQLRLDGFLLEKLMARDPKELLAAYEKAMQAMIEAADPVIALGLRKMNDYSDLLSVTARQRGGFDNRWVDLAEKWLLQSVPCRAYSETAFFRVVDLDPEMEFRDPDPAAPNRAASGGPPLVSSLTLLNTREMSTGQVARIQSALRRYRDRRMPPDASAARSQPATESQGPKPDANLSTRVSEPVTGRPRVDLKWLGVQFPALGAIPGIRGIASSVVEGDRIWILAECGRVAPFRYHAVEVETVGKSVRTLYVAPENGHLLRHGKELLCVLP